MKLLLDENMSYRVHKAIEAHFPGSVHVNFADEPLRSDTVIWQYAKAHGFTIVTFDTDFLQLAALHGAPPKVVLLLLRNPSHAEVARVLLERKTMIEEFAADSATDAPAVMEISH